MTKPTRLDAPPADLRPLDRGPATKKVFGVEPRVQPTMAEERAALEKKWATEESQRLAKSAAPAPPTDLTKAVKAMTDLANIALKAAERSESAARRIEAAMVEKGTPTLKQALAKIDLVHPTKKGQ